MSPEILLGKHRNGTFLSLKGQEFAALSAPTRGGKGVGMVIPNCVNFSDSLVVLDIKKENFQKTAGFRAKHGQDVFLFSPFSKVGETHRYNPLTYLSKDVLERVGDINDLGFILYPVPAKADPFWNDNARALFLGLVLFLMETPSLPFTLGEVFRQGRAKGTGKPIKEYLKGLIDERDASEDPLSDDCVNALNDFMSNSDNTLAGILASFKTPLQTWANPLVDLATSKDDFRLDEVRKKRMSIYIGVTPKQLKSAALLINVMYSQLISLNTDELPEQNLDLKYQCLLLMDEFTAIGRCEAVMSAVSYMAGYNMRLLTIIQSIGQLESVYGKEDARTFMTNHAVQVLFPPREQRDANEYSEMLGYYGMLQSSKGKSRNLGSGGGRSESENSSEQRRALVWPQEMKEMGQQNPPVEIIMYEKCRAVLCNRIRWYVDDVLKARVGLPLPPVPKLDLAAIRAKMEGRFAVLSSRDFTESGRLAISLAALDIDIDELPPAPETDDEASTIESATAFVDSFFAEHVMVEAMSSANSQPDRTPAAEKEASSESAVDALSADESTDLISEADSSVPDEYDEYTI